MQNYCKKWFEIILRPIYFYTVLKEESWKEKAKTEPEQAKQEAPGGMPEPDFKFFLTSLAMQAWIGLGIIANPATQKQEENFGQAKFIIDILDILKEKTKGMIRRGTPIR